MRHSKWLVLMVLGLMVFATTAEAAGGESESGFVRFFRGLFRFPAKTTEKTVDAVTSGTTKAVAIGTQEIENVGEALTGSKEAAVGLVVDPVQGATTTAYETTKEAVMAPVEGFQEAAGHEHPGKEHPGEEPTEHEHPGKEHPGE